MDYLWCNSSLVFEMLTEPGRLLSNAVAVQSVDLVLDGQSLCLFVFVSYNQNMKVS